MGLTGNLGEPRVRALPRGGTIVLTSLGPIQFGAPPETIKDAIAMGLEVPRYWVPLRDWFDRRSGQSWAELEFPTYYNYFRLGRRIHIIGGESDKKRATQVMRESFFGPDRYEALDWAPSVPLEDRVDLARECAYFRATEDGRPIELEDLIEFSCFDESGIVWLSAEVAIRRIADAFEVRDHGVTVAEVADRAAPRPVVKRTVERAHFEPPAFGLTVLGSSHGFDPSGKTTGFVLWVHRRGVLVDPPVDANDLMRDAGVSPKAIDNVVLTHCHADHDSGVMQKILEEGTITLHTTPTILGSFMRKYVALTGEQEELLRRLFRFRPVTLGLPMRIHGAEFRFFYSLHSIPTIGFECYFGGKSFVYSADTLYDPKRIESLVASGVLTPRRRDALLGFPWHHSFVLHEAGVPPIHTPATCLAELPDSVKRRMRLIHISETDLPKDSGLELAHAGLEHTIAFSVEEPPYAEALEMLDALARIDLFSTLTVERCREFLTVARKFQFGTGDLVIGQGQVGDRFYLVVEGEAEVLKEGASVKVHGPGDFFGETALVTGAPRSADVRARTDLTLLGIDKVDFLALVRGTDLVDQLVRLAKNRNLPSWDVMSQNRELVILTSTQKTELQALLEHTSLAEGEALWDYGAPLEAAYLLADAEVVLRERNGDPVATLRRGALVVDVDAMRRHAPLVTRIDVTRGGTAFRISRADLLSFLDRAPALMLALAGVPYVE